MITEKEKDFDSIRKLLLNSYHQWLNAKSNNEHEYREKSYILGMIHVLDFSEKDDHIESLIETMRGEFYHV